MQLMKIREPFPFEIDNIVTNFVSRCGKVDMGGFRARIDTRNGVFYIARRP